MNSQTYSVHGIALQHDGHYYPEGSTLILSDTEAVTLQRWLLPVTPPTVVAASVPTTVIPAGNDAGQIAHQQHWQAALTAAESPKAGKPGKGGDPKPAAASLLPDSEPGQSDSPRTGVQA